MKHRYKIIKGELCQLGRTCKEAPRWKVVSQPGVYWPSKRSEHKRLVVAFYKTYGIGS